MQKNVGKLDRVGRGAAALIMATSAVMAPWPLALRIVAFAVPAIYMGFTALRGTCVGYRLMGVSSCPVSGR